MAVRSLSGLDERDIADVLAVAPRVAPSLDGGRILVTGATGWFGTWLLDALVALDRSESLGLRVVAMSRDPGAFRRRHPELYAASEIEWFEGDVRDVLVDAPGPFTHIIHAATDTTVKSAATATPCDTFETIVCGTLNVLKLAARHPNVKALIVSSGAVYGPQPADVERLAEDYRGAPDFLDAASAYGEGKRAAESLGAIWHETHGVQVTIARCFAFVGPHMPFDAHFAIGNFIRDAVDGERIRVTGNGRPRRTYLYMSDLVVWLLTILVDGRPMRPYNVGAADAITIGALAERCATLAGGGDVEIGFGNASGRDYVPDVERARRELDLQVNVPLDDAIGRSRDWLRGRRGALSGRARGAAAAKSNVAGSQPC